MRPTSERFRTALRSAHVIASSLRLYFPGNPAPVVVPVETGSITFDRLARVRRSGSVQIPWSLEVGYDLGLDLRELPFGGYAQVLRGLRYADGSVELMLLGHLRIESVSWQTLANAASLELADRMAQVADEPFLQPFVPSGAAGVSRTGTLASGSAIVTGLSTTADLLVGMNVTGVGIVPGTKILTIDSGTQVTLTQPVTSLTAQKNVQGLANQARLFNIDGTDNLAVGMTVYVGKNTNGDEISKPGTLISAIPSSSEVTLSLPLNNVTFWEPGHAAGWALADFGASPTQTLVFGGGARIADAALEIVSQVFADEITYRKPNDPNVVTQDAYFSQSRADTLGALAQAAAGEAYFDAEGNFVFDVAAGGTEPVWTVDTGEQGVMVDAEESLARTGVYNGVLVSGQETADQPPVSALVTDDDPASPTLWGGPYGKVARIEASTAVQSVAQATESARTLLEGQLGLGRSLTLTEAPNPALEPGDVVRVIFEDGRIEDHVIDSITLDLQASGAQRLTTRSVYVPAVLERFAPLPSRRFRTFTGGAAWRELEGARRA